MRVGRPRTTCPEPEEMIELGQEMVEWVKENKPLHLSDWYLGEKFIVRDVFKMMIKCEEFRPYYECALKIVSQHYLNKDSPVHPSIAQRWQRVYFKDLREEEDETATFMAKLKAQEQSAVSEADIERYMSVMNQLKSLQSE